MSASLTASRISLEHEQLTSKSELMIESPRYSYSCELDLENAQVFGAVAPAKVRRVLGPISIAGVAYFAVCGGSTGSEGIISAGGPLFGFIGLVVFPIIWCFPIGAITAEMSTAFPHDGGYTVWVLNAFGPFWAFQTGYWSWLAGVLDNALYPALALETITNVWGQVHSPFIRYAIKAGFAIGLAIPNFLGVELVGHSMMFLPALTLLPFLVLAVWAMVKANDWSALFDIRRAETVFNADGVVVGMTGRIDVNWADFLNIFFWNFSGVTSISLFGGEVARPSRTYPIAILLCVSLISITYAIPLFGAVAYNYPHWSTWQEGSFLYIAESIGGKALSQLILLAAFTSSAGIFMAQLFCDSFELYGMAECGLAPAFLTARNRSFDTPHNGILCSLSIILLLIALPFEKILSVTNALVAFYTFAIIVSFLKLRLSHPEFKRPYKVPGSFTVVALLCVPSLLILGYVVFDALSHLLTAVMVAPMLALGLAYGRWQDFVPSQFEQHMSIIN